MDYQAHALFLQIGFLIIALAILATTRGWAALLAALAVVVNGFVIADMLQ